MSDEKLLSVKESAEKLGVNRQRVQTLITEGRLPAQKIGNSYVIKESDLALVADSNVGRPPKSKE